MLRALHISNLAVISEARIELAGGLNCFTGATGAGKSLVIGAVELLLGLRSPGEMLRNGAEEGRVSGVFEIADRETLRRIEAATDVPLLRDAKASGGKDSGKDGKDSAGEGVELLLTRRIFASGRSSIALNGQPITLAMLRAASEQLVDVHGQHDQQYLLKPANQLEVLDAYVGGGGASGGGGSGGGGGGATELRQRYSAVWQELTAGRHRLAELSRDRALRDQQLELYRFQANEIDAAELIPGELQKLEARAAVLGSVERIQKEAGAVYAGLYEADDNVVQQIKTMASTLGQLAEIDPALRNVAVALKDAAVSVEEGSYDLRRYLDRLELDPEELALVNDRLTALGKLASKYAGRRVIGAVTGAGTESSVGEGGEEGEEAEGGEGGQGGDEIDGVLRYRAEIGAELARLERQSEDLGGLEASLGPLQARAEKLAGELSELRRKHAGKLAKEVVSALAELGMERATFEVRVERAAGGELGPSGADVVEFVASTNPGLAASPLRKIASGGELSRIMLALKGILAAGDRVSVLVFDEIDANVGGRLGAVIGTKLRQLARGHQVLCITHLPQIACYADRHLTVRKSQGKDETTSVVRAMEGDERVAEIAEMIGGQHITEVTRAQARELLETARREGQKLETRVTLPAAGTNGAAGRAAVANKASSRR